MSNLVAVPALGTLMGAAIRQMRVGRASEAWQWSLWTGRCRRMRGVHAAAGAAGCSCSGRKLNMARTWACVDLVNRRSRGSRICSRRRSGSCHQLTRVEDCPFFSFSIFEDACKVLVFCIGAGQDFPFNVWIRQSGHKLVRLRNVIKFLVDGKQAVNCFTVNYKLVREPTVEMVTELAVDGSAFQSVTKINEPLCRLLLTCPKGERCRCCWCLYLEVFFEKVGNLLEGPVRRAIG